MTLLETIRAIEEVAKAQPSVKMIVRSDIFRLNAAPEQRYGVFAWTQQQHSGGIQTDMTDFSFNLFYVDRLKEDRSNETEIQSVGIQTLDNILRNLYYAGIWSDTWTFQTFNQRFTDDCAGVWCNVTFHVPIAGTCPEIFGKEISGDYLDSDYNDDFLIY